HFVYYRPGSTTDGTAQTYFGAGRIGAISSERRVSGVQHFMAQIEDFNPFETPVPWKSGPVRNAQISIQAITRAQYDKLINLGVGGPTPIPLDVGTVRAVAEADGLVLAAAIYEQVVAALNSGKHII